jgi:hypothetical protein
VRFTRARPGVYYPSEGSGTNLTRLLALAKMNEECLPHGLHIRGMLERASSSDSVSARQRELHAAVEKTGQRRGAQAAKEGGKLREEMNRCIFRPITLRLPKHLNRALTVGDRYSRPAR